MGLTREGCQATVEVGLQGVGLVDAGERDRSLTSWPCSLGEMQTEKFP